MSLPSETSRSSHIHLTVSCRNWFIKGWLCVRCDEWHRFDFDGQDSAKPAVDWRETRPLGTYYPYSIYRWKL